ncbi:MAG: ATP synthase F1 subunit delta, partial [Candidatus Kryptoniota bacterium]
MAQSRVARRYARALLELGREMDIVEQVSSDVELLRATIFGSRQLKLFLASPIVNHEKKKSVVNELFRPRISDLVYRFVILLIDKGREGLIEEIVVQYQSLLDDMMGIVRADVRGAYQLESYELANIEMKLTKVTRKKVHA